MQQDPDLIARSVEELVGDLNPQQAEAVQYRGLALLIGAGAGSGKTRVLTRRIAWILTQFGAWPSQILAITFTNKAAAEMRERLEGLIGPVAQRMWVSTFHSMCVRMLRADAERLGFTKNFTIYDTDDLKRLYKDIMAELNIDPKRFPVNQLMNRISQAKNDLVTPGNFDAHDPVGKVAERVYERLPERLRAFDFDDLLLYGYLLLKNHADVREAYQDRFRYLMVDEYQDTNRAQYAITQLLAAKRRNIMVVGDDDQSIYSWRGADLRNILVPRREYQKYFKLRGDVPGGEGDQAGAELPQRGQYLGGGQRRHREQPAPQGEAPVHGLGRRGEDLGVSGHRRARRGPLDRRGDRPAPQ